MRLLVVGDAGDDDQGFVGERLAQHGAVTEPLDRDDLPAYADVARAGLLVLLGSARSGHTPEQASVVARESEFVGAALDDGVPVLGICYGSQLLAHALGGTILPSPKPELGVFEIETNDPVLCPPGPWVLMHSDTFTVPSTGISFGSSPGGCQGFADESRSARALAWQFHPEVTPEELSRWLDSLAEWVTMHGGDADAIRTEGFARRDQLRDNAYALTDAALAWLLA